jgi:hypothetical protein
VVTATLPARRSLLGKALGVASGHSGAARKRMAAVLAKARENIPTAAALAAADFGGFTVWHHGGWFVLAASIIVLHFAVSD